MRVWTVMVLAGCLPALEDECAPGSDPCADGLECIGGVCVEGARPADGGAPIDAMKAPDQSVAPPDTGSADRVAPPPECPEGYGDADDIPENGCEHGCEVPGPRGTLVSETDAPAEGGELSLAVDPDGERMLIAWTNAEGRLHSWTNGQVRALGGERARFTRPDVMSFGAGWAVAALPRERVDAQVVGFRFEQGQFTGIAIVAKDPAPPAVVRIGSLGGETAPAAIFIDERTIRDTGDWVLKLAPLEPGEGVRNPLVVEAFPQATQRKVAATATDRGIVVALAEHGRDGDALRLVRMEPSGAFIDSSRVPIDGPIEEVSAVHTPNGVLFGAIGPDRMYAGRLVFSQGPAPTALFDIDTGDLPMRDLQMLSLPRGDAALVRIVDGPVTMILLGETGAVAWAEPLVGPRDAVAGVAAAAGVTGLAVGWVRENRDERQLLRARPECQ